MRNPGLTHTDGRSIVVNVEYNQLDAAPQCLLQGKTAEHVSERRTLNPESYIVSTLNPKLGVFRVMDRRLGG